MLTINLSLRNIMKTFLSLLFSMLISIGAFADNSATASMRRMMMRLSPSHAKSFVFQQIQSEKDCFILQSVGGRIKISGNDANSMAVGLNYYLKNYCMTTVSWFLADPVELPKVLPHIKGTVKINAKVPVRFFLNYCTYGYTMPWWSWKDWERFIDWMALNGVNMPLAITGQEAIWYNVWKKFGLSDIEIRSYFTGPAHLPWHRMSNIDAWQGPLPMSWLDNQKELQEKIVAREREFNMKPVLPAFAGHIPAALKRIYPQIHTTLVNEWDGFGPECQCTFLSPMDSLFNVIQKSYLTEQTKLYGTDHIYGADPFNEVDPPTWEPDSLAMMSSHIYKSMKAVDKDAKWLQMTWLFYYHAKNWTAPRIKAMVRGVPQDKMLLLDYFCENTEIWKRSDSYFGQPFIWCYLGNFGGNTIVCGPMKLVSSRLANTYQNAGKNFVGVGATLEALDVNQFAYEFVLDKAWNIPQNDKEWFSNLIGRRVGKKNDVTASIGKLMLDSVLTRISDSPQGTLIEKRPCLENTEFEIGHLFASKDQQRNLLKVWHQLLSIPNVNRDSYKFDVINVGRQVLGGYFHELRDQFTEAYKKGDVERLKLIGNRMKSILIDVDALVSCHPTFSLKHWIESARVFGKDAAEKDYYEKNARTILTVWGGGPALTDYARRGWSGLISNYYAPRWNNFIDEVIKCSEKHEKFDESAFTKNCYILEHKFMEPSYPIVYNRSQDGIKLAKKLETKYFNNGGK